MSPKSKKLAPLIQSDAAILDYTHLLSQVYNIPVQCSEMSSEMDPKVWEKIGTIVAAKLADHDTKVSSKRYDLLFSKLGDNESELNKVKADVSVLYKSVKIIEDIKGFNEASESKKQFDLITST